MKSNSTIVRPAITTKIAASVLALTCATAWKLSAAEIVWEGTGGISGSTDVNTEGAYFGSWAPADANAASFPVNGVTFKGVSDLPDFQTTLGGGYSGFGTPSTPDGNYDSLLTSGAYADNGAATFGWDGMTPGNTYLVQIWVEDLRNLGVTRSETFSGGSDVSPAVFLSGGRHWQRQLRYWYIRCRCLGCGNDNNQPILYRRSELPGKSR